MMPDCFLDSLKGQQRHRTAVACVALVLVVPAPVMASNKEICVAAHALCQQLSLQHQTVEAREQLVICSDPVCPGLVREDCSQWLVEMDMKLVSVSARPLVAAARPPRVTHDVPQVYTKAMAPRGQPGRSLGSQSLSKSSQARPAATPARPCRAFTHLSTPTPSQHRPPVECVFRSRQQPPPSKQW
jgi:hypothetical protein